MATPGAKRLGKELPQCQKKFEVEKKAVDAGAGPVAAALLAALALADELKRAEDELAEIKAALAERVAALRAAVS